MILKNESLQFKLDGYPSGSNIGLEKGDVWIKLKISVKDANKVFKFEEDALSKSELEYLVKKLKEFMNTKSIKKERISFIKNYIVFYFETKKRNKKNVKMKFVHINNTSTNYMVLFEDEEVFELISRIESLKKD